MTIRDTIKAAIDRSGETHRAIAARACLTPPQLSRYLRTGVARSDVLERLLAALGLEVRQIRR